MYVGPMELQLLAQLDALLDKPVEVHYVGVPIPGDKGTRLQFSEDC